MYSLHDITSVCPKLEPLASDESCCREEESLRLMNHANGQMETLVRVSAENNNGLMMESGQLDVYGKTPCVEMSVYEGITTNNTIAYEVKSMATVVKTLPADAYHGNASGQMSYATVKIPYEIKSIGTIEKPIPFGSKPNGIEKSRPDEAYHSNTCGQRSNGAIKIPYEIKSIGSIEKPLLPEDSYPTSVSEEMPHGKILNVYTVPVYENGGSHEVYYYPMESDTQEGGAISQTSQAGTPVSYVYDSGYDPCERTRSKPEVTPSPAGLAAYQSSTYGTIPRDQLGPDRLSPPYDVLNQEKAPGLQMNTFRGTHRALTPYEIGAQPRPSCNCSCHHSDPGSSHFPAFGLRNERPSVIMVPATWNGEVMSDAAGKFESTAHGIRQDLQQKEYHELDDSDSSDDGDEDGKHEKYFRKNIDGTTARFKLSKEDWKRIPINTFPSGGRLLSGDWTRIFLSKVKESNPWCSLRFKNNHVRSENSRKIHSAVFFRGGAECKRPECNVKVRFVIRKEKGKHVEVTYVGNVCHNSQPGSGDVITDKRKKRCVRRPKFTSSLDD